MGIIANIKKALLGVGNNDTGYSSGQILRSFSRNKGSMCRDMYDVLGYEKNPLPSSYLQRYKRQDIAKRIVESYPQAVWGNPPDVYVGDSLEEKDIYFASIFNDIVTRLDLYNKLNRLDILSSLGRYAILLIGVNSDYDLDVPISNVVSIDNIVYLTPYGEHNALIEMVDSDVTSPRYGKPTMYKILTEDSKKSLLVHHSRVIHVAEGTLDNDVYGIPVLEPVLNRLCDLEKVVGGGAEMFWLNGRGGLSLNADINAKRLDNESLTTHADDYANRLTRILITKAIDVRTLQFNVAEPTGYVSALLDLISSATGIPKRILIGSERGELASSQDESSWLTRIAERRVQFCEPMILRKLIDRLNAIGVFSNLREYKVLWGDLIGENAQEKADVGLKRANALASYTNSFGANLIVPERQFVEDVLGMEYRGDEIADSLASEREDVERDISMNEEDSKDGFKR